MARMHLSCADSYKDLAYETRSSPGHASPDWQGLTSVNPDIAGWIFVDELSMSLPVVRPHDDRDANWYLTHDFWGRRSLMGCPYIDDRCTADSEQIMVYGHNTADPSAMFGPLRQLLDPSIFSACGNAFWITPDEGPIRARPLFVIEVHAEYQAIQHFDFEDRTSFSKMLETVSKESAAQAPDIAHHLKNVNRVLSLVTCSSPSPSERMRTIAVFDIS